MSIDDDGDDDNGCGNDDGSGDEYEDKAVLFYASESVAQPDTVYVNLTATNCLSKLS